MHTNELPRENSGLENSRCKAGDFFVKDLRRVSGDLKLGRIQQYKPLILTNEIN